MARTAGGRPPPGGSAPTDALAFGVTLAIISVMVMGLAVNWVAAALLALTIAFYVFVYTLWLKRRTPQNIVIGGAAGAFPPMVGWAAVTGEVEPRLDRPVPDHLRLDAAAFLGAVALPLPATTRGSACRCCRWSPGPRRPAGTSWATRWRCCR